MTQIIQTAKLITRWLNSCQTAEQLGLFPGLIQTFIFQRFEGKVKDYVLEQIIKNLYRDLRNKFRGLRVSSNIALMEEEAKNPRIYDYVIDAEGKLIGHLKSVPL